MNNPIWGFDSTKSIVEKHTEVIEEQAMEFAEDWAMGAKTSTDFWETTVDTFLADYRAAYDDMGLEFDPEV